MRSARRRFSLAAAVVLSGAAISAGTVALTEGDHTRTVTVTRVQTVQQSAATTSPEEIYRRSRGALVSITSTTGDGTAAGSGFLVSPDGYIVTNAHVVDGASAVSVRVGEGAVSHTAQVVGTDTTSDIALLKIDTGGRRLPTLSFADSDAVSVGDPAYAIGDPYQLRGSFTAGVISGLHRTIDSPASYGIPNTIQTDAALNPGNSGGPLLDAQGRVIGVNSQIESAGRTESGGASSAPGLGFAIPANTVKRVVAQLRATGHATHAYLGVSLADATTPVAGARVGGVRAGGPAAQAGVQDGDVVTRAGGTTVTDAEDLSSVVDGHAPGDRLTLELRRGGATSTVTVTLGTRPA